ncbi:hypothetical protein, variant, partial [Puccinia triticina 1-1 BBBD Race 1]
MTPASFRLSAQLVTPLSRALSARPARPAWHPNARGPRLASYSSAGSSSSSQQQQERPSSSWTDGVAAQAVFGSLGGVLILGFGGSVLLLLQLRLLFVYPVRTGLSACPSAFQVSLPHLKMAVAFEPGYDPVLVLNKASERVPRKPELSRPSYKPGVSTEEDDGCPEGEDEEQVEEVVWIARREQELIDQIIHGKLAGQYWLITGPKGTGKFSLIADAMTRNQADGQSSIQHKPLPGLSSLLTAPNTSPELTQNHAFFSSVHLRQDEGSYSLLLQLQQRAESWSQAGIVTIVFCSDDHWPYASLKKNASRMSVLTVKDLTKQEAVRAIRTERMKLWREARPADDPEIEALWTLVGGRIAHLSGCMKHKDMLHAAKLIIEREKQWLLSRIGL